MLYVSFMLTFLQTFNVALEELWQNAVGSELMKNTAQELLGHTSDITRYQHTTQTDTNTHVTYTEQKLHTCQCVLITLPFSLAGEVRASSQPIKDKMS